MHSDLLLGSSSPMLLIGAALIVTYLLSVANWRARSRGLPFPPGPKPLPLLGNVFNFFPVFKGWYKIQQLSADYGDVIHFRVLGQSFIALTSPGVISEYLDKRSSNTSDRKQSPMVKLTGLHYNFSLMPYGPRWRQHRRVFWQYFNHNASLSHRPVQRSTAHIFLEELLMDPSRMLEHAKFTLGASILKVVYGIVAESGDDKYLSMLHTASVAISQGIVPGKFMVEHLPFLQHVPTWFPGAYSQRVWKEWQSGSIEARDGPYAFVREHLNDTSVQQSMVGRQLHKLDLSTEDDREENTTSNAAAVAFQAGFDTIFSTLNAVLLALSLHPEVVKRAQAELDAVVGPYRLPDFDDQGALVYITATVLEALRWHNVTPLSVAHCTTADDEWRGWFIPAGTIILPNIWACMHDPIAYPEPEEFRPERFIRDGQINPDVRNPLDLVFGQGRRICPGRYFAQAGLFINIASVLHVFDISPPKDEHGLPIHVKYEMSDGLLSYPVDSRCTILPRSPEAVALIRAHAATARAARGE